MLPQKAKVLRDGQKKEVFVPELVVGDIVLLETGERVPADIRILECQGKSVSLAVATVTFLFLGKKSPRLSLSSTTHTTHTHTYTHTVKHRRRRRHRRSFIS